MRAQNTIEVVEARLVKETLIGRCSGVVAGERLDLDVFDRSGDQLEWTRLVAAGYSSAREANVESFRVAPMTGRRRYSRI